MDKRNRGSLIPTSSWLVCNDGGMDLRLLDTVVFVYSATNNINSNCRTLIEGGGNICFGRGVKKQ